MNYYQSSSSSTGTITILEAPEPIKQQSSDASKEDFGWRQYTATTPTAYNQYAQNPRTSPSAYRNPYLETPRISQSSTVNQFKVVPKPTSKHNECRTQHPDKIQQPQINKIFLKAQQQMQKLKQVAAPTHYPKAPQAVLETWGDPDARQTFPLASEDERTRKPFILNGKDGCRTEEGAAVSDYKRIRELFIPSRKDGTRTKEAAMVSNGSKRRDEFIPGDRDSRQRQTDATSSDDGTRSEPFTASGEDQQRTQTVAVASDDPERREGFIPGDRNSRRRQPNATASDDGRRSEPFIPSRQGGRRIQAAAVSSDEPQRREGSIPGDRDPRQTQTDATSSDDGTRSEPFAPSGQDGSRREEIPSASDDLLAVHEKIADFPRVKKTILMFTDNDVLVQTRQQSQLELNKSFIDPDYIDYNHCYQLVFLGDDIDVDDRYNYFVKHIKHYICAVECIDELSTEEPMHTLVVLSGLYVNDEKVAAHLKSIGKVEYIYSLTATPADTSQMCQYADICQSKNDLCRLIEDRIRNFYNNTTVFCFLPNDTEERKMNTRYLTIEQADFIWTQLLFEQVLTMPEMKFSKEATINYLQCYYHENPGMLNNITEFAQTYQRTKTALQWYTPDTFIYPLVNKAIRTQNIKAFFELGYFLNDLKNDINQLKSESLTSTIFWHQNMSTQELEKIKKNIGGLIMTNSLIWATKEPDIKPLSGTSVLFQLECDSAKQYDGKLIIPPGSVFNIKWVHTSQIDLIPCVYLIKNNGYDPLKSVEDIADSDSLLTSGKFLIITNQFEKAKTYYEEISLRFPSRCFIHNHLAYICTEIGLHSQAIGHYKAGIEIQESILRTEFNENKQVDSLINLGQLYHTIGENLKAWQYLERALRMTSNKLPIDQIAIGTCNSLLSLIYDSLGDYDKARKHAEHGLQAHILSLPPNHSLTAISYFNAGCIYRHLHRYKLALRCLKKALKISKKILRLHYRQLAPIFHNLGLVYHQIDDYENALDNYEEELDILCLDSDLIDTVRISIVYELLEELSLHQTATPMLKERALNMQKRCLTVLGMRSNESGEVTYRVAELLHAGQTQFVASVESQPILQEQKSEPFMIKTATQAIAEVLNIGQSTLWSPINWGHGSLQSATEPTIIKTATLSLNQIDFMFPGNKKKRMEDEQNLEGCTLVWIDRNLDDPDVDKLLAKFHLPIRMCEMISYIRGFQNPTEAVQYISKADEQDIFVVVTPEEVTNEPFMSELIDQPQVKFVYVFNPDNQPVEFKPHPKQRGAFTELKPLILRLKSDVDSYDTNSEMLFNVLNSEQIERSFRNLTQESVTFMWYDITIDILPRLKQKNAKQEMIEFCRSHYSNNENLLEKITEFEKTYKSEDAALWYSKDTFVYRIVNYALRTQNAATIYNFRYYICDLHNQLVKMHQNFIRMLPSQEQILSLYRGQKIKTKEFERCKQDALISINMFFSTSMCSPVAVMFLGDGIESTSRSIFFEIAVDTKIDAKPYAPLDRNVNQESEREVLFSIGSIFRIDLIEEKALGKAELVKLTLSKHENIQIQKMKLHWKRLLNLDKNPVPETAWCTFLFTLGEYNAAEEHLLKLLNEQPMDDESFWSIHSDLGKTYYEKEHWEKSLFHYYQALEIIEKHLLRSEKDGTHRELYPAWHLLLRRSVLYNDIAGVLQKMGDKNAALQLYQAALAIDTDTRCGRPDWYEIAKTYNNIGLLHMGINENEKAFEYIEKAREICSSPMIDSGPVNINSNLAAIYNNIGLIHKTKGHFKSATNAFKKSVKLARKALPENHPSLVQYTKNLADLERDGKGVDVNLPSQANNKNNA